MPHICFITPPKQFAKLSAIDESLQVAQRTQHLSHYLPYIVHGVCSAFTDINQNFYFSPLYFYLVCAAIFIFLLVLGLQERSPSAGGEYVK